MMLSPRISSTRNAPGCSSSSSRPTQTQSRQKIRSFSTANTLLERYQLDGRVASRPASRGGGSWVLTEVQILVGSEPRHHRTALPAQGCIAPVAQGRRVGIQFPSIPVTARSEERRVGKECRSGETA